MKLFERFDYFEKKIPYFLKFCLIATPWPCSPHGFLHLRTNWQIIPRGTRLFYSYNLTKCKDPFGGDCLDVIVCYTCMTHSRSLTFIIYFFSTHSPKKKKKVFRKKILSLSFFFFFAKSLSCHYHLNMLNSSSIYFSNHMLRA